MSESIIVAILAFGGTLFGSVVGILTANKLVNHRIEQLEKAIERYSNFAERLVILERDRDAVLRRLDQIEQILRKLEQRGGI